MHMERSSGEVSCVQKASQAVSVTGGNKNAIPSWLEHLPEIPLVAPKFEHAEAIYNTFAVEVRT